MAIKIPKFGESTRERRPSNYGEGGRAVGGEARRNQLAHKTASKTSKAPKPSPPVKDMPEPGGHPAHLQEAAKEKGRGTPPSANAFAKLKALQQHAEKRATALAGKPVAGTPSLVPELASSEPVSADILDQLFEQRREVERPTRARADRQARTAKMKGRFPLLKIGANDDGIEERGQETEPSSAGPIANADRATANSSAAAKDPLHAGRGDHSTAGGGEDGTREAASNPNQLSLFGLDVLAGAGRKVINETTVSEIMPSVGMAGTVDVRAADAEQADPGCDDHFAAQTAGAYPDRSQRSSPGGEGVTLGAGKDGLGDGHPEATDRDGDALSTRRHLPVLDGSAQPTSVDALTAGRIAPPGAPLAPRVSGKQPNPIREGVTPYSEEQEEQIAGILSLPGVNCNNCPAAESCPEFKENSVCAFDEEFSGLTSRDLGNLIPAMEVIADLQLKRAFRGYLIEQRAAGGHIDPNVSRQFEIAAMARERVARLKAPVQKQASRSISIIAKETGPGAVAQGGGLVSRLLAGVTGSMPTHDDGVLVLNMPEESGE